jgi:hypothetical protein
MAWQMSVGMSLRRAPPAIISSDRRWDNKSGSTRTRSSSKGVVTAALTMLYLELSLT